MSTEQYITVAPYSWLYYLVFFKFISLGDCGKPEHSDFFVLITDNSFFFFFGKMTSLLTS